MKWIPITQRVPDSSRYILLSFENFSVPMVGRYEEDEEGGAFYVGDDFEPLSKSGVFVNAWMELPKCYKEPKEIQWQMDIYDYLRG